MTNIIQVSVVLLTLMGSNQAQSETPLDWAVGDRASYELLIYGNMGEKTREVVKDTGDTLWIRTESNFNTRDSIVMEQYRKSDGKLITKIVDGEIVKIRRLELIHRERSKISVPAGDFDCDLEFYKGKSVFGKQIIEQCSNPEQTVMDGLLYKKAPWFGLPLVTRMTKFHRVPRESVIASE